MEFYDIHEQTKYKVTISMPENPEDLSDCFVTKEELGDLIGDRFWYTGTQERTFYLNAVISAEVKRLGEELDASGKKTIPIDDEELLDVLKDGYVSDYDEEGRFGRHGDRLCYARRYKRVKKKPTKTDVRQIWYAFQSGFRDKFGCYPSHIPTYDRGLNMFKAFQEIVGWRRVSANLDRENMKFYRQIWVNPEEYV